jgi:probable DNA repair protein
MTAIIVTPTRRLAQHLIKEILQSQLASAALLETPKVYALEDWLDYLWNCLQMDSAQQQMPLRLNQWQELALWQQIVAEHPLNKVLLRPSETAYTLKQAWQTVYQWNLTIEEIDSFHNEDVDAFKEWAIQFRNYCDKHHFIDKARQIRFLTINAKRLSQSLSNQFTFYGFDEIVPSVEALLNALQENGIICNHSESKSIANITPTAFSFFDKKQEYFAAANWAKAQLAQNPSQSIAIVIPNLANEWNEVERIFTQVFCPQTLLTAKHDEDKPFNISSGQELSTLPIIHTAFQLLNQVIYAAEKSKWSHLLRSPYLPGAIEEQSARALCDFALQKQNKLQWRLNEIIPFIKKIAAEQNIPLSILLKHLEELMEKGQSYFFRTGDGTQRLPVSQWASIFSLWLQAVGWPGDRELDSKEYQAIQRWFMLLNEMGTLEVVKQHWSAAEALSYLQRQATNTLFQAESKEKSLHILGVLEAAGLTFDKMWITSLNDDIWPTAPKPNPFLPLTLQREKNMPHASSERELAFARRIFQRLLQSAQQITVSYPRSDNETPLLPSSLLKEFTIENNTQKNIIDHWQAVYAKSSEIVLEQLQDEIALPISKGTEMVGGSQLLALQAACPFRAFAIFRCNIEEWPSQNLGLTPLQRGSILHSCLEWLWQQIASWEKLQTYAESELDLLIDKAISYGLKQAESELRALGMIYRNIETNRLKELITCWLELEKQREPFSVAAIEESKKVTLGGITLKLRVDRRDKLHSGEEIIIDYKTGNSHILQWHGERPDAPQLPLYAVTNENCRGVVFAQTQTNAVEWKGITAQENYLPEVPAVSALRAPWNAQDWESLVEEWRDILEKLAGDFARGYARVDPKNQQTCEFCDLKSLCRV